MCFSLCICRLKLNDTPVFVATARVARCVAYMMTNIGFRNGIFHLFASSAVQSEDRCVMTFSLDGRHTSRSQHTKRIVTNTPFCARSTNIGRVCICETYVPEYVVNTITSNHESMTRCVASKICVANVKVLIQIHSTNPDIKGVRKDGRMTACLAEVKH